jgi:hypothetical protein
MQNNFQASNDPRDHFLIESAFLFGADFSRRVAGLSKKRISVYRDI